MWSESQLEALEEKDHSLTELINELMTKVIEEQPRLYRVC